MRRTSPLWPLLAIGLAVMPARAQERISRLGEYRGYSDSTYDGWQRSSRYITMRDGVRLAADIFRPTRGGVLHTERLPVVWAHQRYHRATTVNGRLVTLVEQSPWIKTLLAHGYVAAVVDTRGGGASFGIQRGFYAPEEVRDNYDVTEWLAAEPWSSGKIGMFGRSYLAHAQLFAASTAPPHLKAVFPEMAIFDFYGLWLGGIFQDKGLANWGKLTEQLDRSVEFDWFGRKFGRVAPVDGDSGEALLRQALEAHEANWDVLGLFRRAPYRNSVDPETGVRPHLERSPATVLPRINRSGVAVYQLSGWLDAAPREAMLIYANLTVPERLVMGTWFHTQTTIDLGAEHLRWYDYWLKGIDNGIMDEPPIHYATFNAPAGREWRTARRWPLPEERRTPMYFGPGPSGSIRSLNDGGLGRARPGGTGADSGLVDTTRSAGPATRFSNGYGGPAGYRDQAADDAKGWTYTTEPLALALEVTGHPIVRLWLSADRPDADVFIQLEEVLPSGESRFVTDGRLRASHAATAQPPYRYLGLPFHPSTRAALVSLGRTPRLLEIDLFPTSYIFRSGSRIRVLVAGADFDTHEPSAPPPHFVIHRSARHPSSIDLPVIPAAR